MNSDKFISDLENCLTDFAKLHDIDYDVSSRSDMSELQHILIDTLGYNAYFPFNSYGDNAEKEVYALAVYLQATARLTFLKSVTAHDVCLTHVDIGDALDGFKRAIERGHTDLYCFKKYFDNIIEYILEENLTMRASVSYGKKKKVRIIEGDLKLLCTRPCEDDYFMGDITYLLEFSSEELEKPIYYYATHWFGMVGHEEGVSLSSVKPISNYVQVIGGNSSMGTNKEYRPNFYGGRFTLDNSQTYNDEEFNNNKYVQFIIDKGDVCQVKVAYEKWQAKQESLKKSVKERER